MENTHNFTNIYMTRSNGALVLRNTVSESLMSLFVSCNDIVADIAERISFAEHGKLVAESSEFTQGAKPGFWVKTGTACCKRFDAKKHIYTYLGTNCTWTTLTDFCWKFVGTI